MPDARTLPTVPRLPSVPCCLTFLGQQSASAGRYPRVEPEQQEATAVIQLRLETELGARHQFTGLRHHLRPAEIRGRHETC